MRGKTDTLANSAAVYTVTCHFCDTGQHKSCTARPDVTLTSRSYSCQCSCQPKPISRYGLAAPVLSAAGRVVGVRTGDGRVYAYGPGVVLA